MAPSSGSHPANTTINGFVFTSGKQADLSTIEHIAYQIYTQNTIPFDSLYGAFSIFVVYPDTLQNEYKRRGEPFPANIPIGKDKYHNYLIGYNSRLDAVQAAVLRKKLPLLPEFVAGRQANATAYDAALAGTGYPCGDL